MAQFIFFQNNENKSNKINKRKYFTYIINLKILHSVKLSIVISEQVMVNIYFK